MAVRLLTFKNEQLLRECSVYDYHSYVQHLCHNPSPWRGQRVDHAHLCLNRKTMQRRDKKQKQLEKLKTETMGQLKVSGNSLLWSLQCRQGPQYGSYSVSSDQNTQEK